MSSTPAEKNNQPARARIGLIHVDEKSLAIFRDCFKQFEMEILEVSSVEEFARQKIEGLVLSLDHGDAEKILETIRKSPLNMRAVVFGLEEQPKAASRFLRYGISVVLHAPVDRMAVVKAIRSTRALLLNEFRRYVRIPLAVEVAVDTGPTMFSSYTEEMSGGGFSFHVPQGIAMPTGTFFVAFTLPGSQKLTMNVTVCWTSESERTIGVRFDPTSPARETVRKWVDDFLQLS